MRTPLFTPLGAARAEAPASLSVTQANQRARQLLERQLGQIVVEGELSNVKCVSGHWYMTLRDAQSQLPMALFKRDAAGLRFQPTHGQRVTARGRLTVYSPYGRYQLVADSLEPQGAGALQAEFERLKAKLADEGLFAPETKRPLRRLPATVAVVTSPTGAVIRDICHVAERRFVHPRILVFPARVQGVASAPGIAEGIRRASAAAAQANISVVIVARGGGSFEDLCGFNDEAVARAISACPVPVVSAVGHETDFTIADFVADVRAPTPSAAAELVFPVLSDVRAQCTQPLQRAERSVRTRLEGERRRLVHAVSGVRAGRHRFRDFQQRLDGALDRSTQALRVQIQNHRRHAHRCETRLASAHPRTRLLQVRHRLLAARERLESVMRAGLRQRRARLDSLEGRVRALSPLAVLDRGYAIVRSEDGTAVRRGDSLRPGDQVSVRVAQGGFIADVRETSPES